MIGYRIAIAEGYRTLQRGIQAIVNVTMSTFLGLRMKLMHFHGLLFCIIRRLFSLKRIENGAENSNMHE